MSDLTERLRECQPPNLADEEMCREAADEIERLQDILDRVDAAKEAEIERLEALSKQIEISAGLKCPNSACDDRGGYPVQDGPDSCYEEQCEFCWTVPDSIFNRNREALQETE